MWRLRYATWHGGNVVYIDGPTVETFVDVAELVAHEFGSQAYLDVYDGVPGVPVKDAAGVLIARLVRLDT